MNSSVQALQDVSSDTPLSALFNTQKNAYLNSPIPTYQQRKNNLINLKKMLSENRDAIIEAIDKDYGSRSWHESVFAEFIAVFDSLAFITKNVRKWMKPQKRHVDFTMFPGAKNLLTPQPLGVVGIIVPWNFPINLSFIPIATALAAGNRAMVKMSENSIHLSELLTQISPKYFPQDTLTFLVETGGVGIELSSLPLDLILFTGSVNTGKAVMASAAKNLTPVILELGGKSPAIIDPEYPIDKAIERIMYAKQMNAGQICLNVDYVFVHESQVDTFTEKAKTWVKQHVADINSTDYTAVIDSRSVTRLEETLTNASENGATVINLNNQDIDHDNKKFPLHLVLNSTASMHIRERETFGPILLVMSYQNPEEVINYVNSHDRPLGLYVFSNNKSLTNRYITHIMSGGVTVNDTLLHAFQDDMPFGGVGPSGMGHYHGYEGFASFSKMRPVFYQSKFSAMGMLLPPYRNNLTKAYHFLLKLKG